MNLVIFLHLERTGGSTINGWFSSVQNIFTRNVNYFEFPAGIPNTWTIDFENLDSDICFISGHFTLHSVREVIDLEMFNKVLIFTVLRDPIERIFSGYRLWLRSPDWFPDLLDTSKNFPNYYEKIRDLYSKNLACRRISGTQSSIEAIEEIESSEIIFGVTDDLNKFASKLNEQIQKMNPNVFLKTSLSKSNEGLSLSGESYASHGIDQNAIDMVRDDNKEDLILYKIESTSII